MRTALILSFAALLTLATVPARAQDVDQSAPEPFGRDANSIILNEMLLAAVSGIAIFSPKVYGGLLLASAPIVHFATGKDETPLMRWGLPAFYVVLGVYNMTVLEDNSGDEARIFRENFAAWNGMYIYALTHPAPESGGPVSAGVTALPGRLMLTASLHF